MKTGEMGILNVGAGDTKIVFDPANPQDMIRAARIVKDMLRRGYALLVLVQADPPTYRRATDFDEATCEYIIADFDPIIAKEHDNEEATQQQEAEAVSADQPQTKPGTKNRRIPAASTKSVAVARTAGG